MKTYNLTRQIILGVTGLSAACGMLLSCAKDTPEDPNPGPTIPEEELNNQIEYNGGEWLFISSAIYERTGDGYSFYLSPAEEVTTVSGMLEADEDYLMVQVTSADGEVDTDTDDFTVSYGDLTVSNTDMKNVKDMSLSVTFDAGSSLLTLTLDITMTGGTTLKADFNRTCSAAIPRELNNEYEIDHVVTEIKSAVAVKSKREGATTYYLYSGEGMTEPSADVTPDIVIYLDDNYIGKNIDLAMSGQDYVKVDGPDGFSSASGAMTGSLLVTEDTESGNNILTITLDAVSGDTRLRAGYRKVYATTYKALNELTVTRPSGEGSTAAVSNVFLYNYSEGTTSQRIFMLGTAEGATSPEELKASGEKAVKITVASEGTSFTGNNFDLVLYDYEGSGITTGIDSPSIAKMEGEIYTDVIGTKTYLYYKVTFTGTNGATQTITVEGDWYGEATTVEENTDLTPVAPVESAITITSATGGQLYHAELERVEMRRENNYNHRLAGSLIDTFDAYFFYFIPTGTDDFYTGSYALDQTYSRAVIPLLMIPVSYVPSTDLVFAEKASPHWNLYYSTTNLQGQQYYEAYSGDYGYTTNCPEDAVISITQNEDKTWRIKFTMTDSYNGGKGSGNSLVIEWEGKLTKYTGTKTNVLTESDY